MMKKHLSDIICIIIFIIVVCIVFYIKTAKHPDIEINTINAIDEYVNNDSMMDTEENIFSDK